MAFCDIHLFVAAGVFITNKFLSVPKIVLDFPDEENVWHDPHRIFQWQDLSSYSHLQFFCLIIHLFLLEYKCCG